MTTITITGVADTDRELGFEADKMVQMAEVETAEQLAYLFGEAARSLGFTYVEDVVFYGDKGNSWSSMDYTGK